MTGRGRRLVGALAAAVALTSCDASLHTYRRVGTAGALVSIAGAVGRVVGTQVVAPRHEIAGQAVAGTSASLSLAGLLMGIYALDGLMRAESAQTLGRNPRLGLDPYEDATVGRPRSADPP
ncbi:MAG: hypothetical protein H6698_03040 [Myxococcales bacterium]|nr:hypothetical protein [Myxococcales bacterium]MCB9532084.1 hypothetical protein [Myxococcales bacterium]MCB9533291.1 hypothetical protein [Myxococcales bacterium]